MPKSHSLMRGCRLRLCPSRHNLISAARGSKCAFERWSRPIPVVAYSFGDMRIRVLYFGVLRDAFGYADSEVLLAEGASVADLLRVVQGREGFWDSIAVAVNREYAKREDLLKEGDEVALLPPVSGGW